MPPVGGLWGPQGPPILLFPWQWWSGARGIRVASQSGSPIAHPALSTTTLCFHVAALLFICGLSNFFLASTVRHTRRPYWRKLLRPHRGSCSGHYYYYPPAAVLATEVRCCAAQGQSPATSGGAAPARGGGGRQRDAVQPAVVHPPALGRLPAPGSPGPGASGDSHIYQMTGQFGHLLS